MLMRTNSEIWALGLFTFWRKDAPFLCLQLFLGMTQHFWGEKTLLFRSKPTDILFIQLLKYFPADTQLVSPQEYIPGTFSIGLTQTVMKEANECLALDCQSPWVLSAVFECVDAHWHH